MSIDDTETSRGRTEPFLSYCLKRTMRSRGEKVEYYDECEFLEPEMNAIFAIQENRFNACRMMREPYVDPEALL